MSKFVIIRLGKDSVSDIQRLDSFRKSPPTPDVFTIKCKQVPTNIGTGDYALFCFGSDNSQGSPTTWVRGIRALGTIKEKTGGPNYNDTWEVSVEIKVVLPESIVRRDLLAHAATAYYWCSGIPTIGIEANSQQTIQLVKEDDPHQSIPALFYGIASHTPSFRADVERLYPDLRSTFNYTPPSPLGDSSADAARHGSASTVGANTIYFGAPGTGKSTMVKKNIGTSLSFRTQFHPEFNHADLIGSYRPVVGFEPEGSNRIVGHDGIETTRPVNYFSFVPGPLTEALECAFGKNGSEESAPHVFLIIEEINRGDCAAIFGDIFQLLDRNESGRSEYGITARPELKNHFISKKIDYNIVGDGKLYLPENLSILATMNTSDQSLFPMDSAFKRRWQWEACPIDFTQLIDFCGNTRPTLNDGVLNWDWIELLKRINERIVKDRMEDKQIGPWFVKPSPSGLVPFEVFVNKCLFYLWHDVFKDEQLSDLSPFSSDGPEVFEKMQSNVKTSGLKAGLKEEILDGLQINENSGAGSLDVKVQSAQ